GGGGGAVGRGIADRDGLVAGVGQGHREDERRGPGVALVARHVVDGDRRLAVVVDDRALALTIRDGGVGGAGQVYEERFVLLEFGVAVDVDGDGLSDLTGQEGHRAAGGLVIVVGGGGGAVRGGVVHGHGLERGVGQGHHEDERRGPGVALVGRPVANGDGGLGVVVEDGAGAGAHQDGRVAGVGQVDQERLIQLELGVADHVDGD